MRIVDTIFAGALVTVVTWTPPAAVPPVAAPPPAPTEMPSTHGPAAGLEQHPVWALRAIACMRLETSPDPAAILILRDLSRDPDARVRSFATAARFLRQDPPSADTLFADADARVVRTAVRGGLRPEPEALAALVLPMLRPEDPGACLTAIEIAASTEEPRVRLRAVDALGRVLMRLDRPGAGMFAPRLERLTGERPGERPIDWQRWWQLGNPRNRPLRNPGFTSAHAIAQTDPATFDAFARALRVLVDRPIDLAICIDATQSMWRDLPKAQALADGIARSIVDLVPESRLGVVAYRDRRSDFLARVLPLGPSFDAWRRELWNTVAEKGGSSPEAVFDGLTATFADSGWDERHHNLVVLIGDGPPHPGTRGFCAALAATARERTQTTTFVVSTRAEGVEREIKGFTEIAEAGGGKVVRLHESASLPSQILGGDFGDAWSDLLAAFRDRCELLVR